MFFSLSLIVASATTVFAQGGLLGSPSAAAASTLATAAPLPGCGGCYIIADVDQYIFADYTSTQTATVIQSHGVGSNGTMIATTYIQPVGQFSYDAQGLLSGTPYAASYIPLSGTVLTVGPLELTSPTAYNVFNGYTAYSLVSNGGSCMTSAYFSTALATPISIKFNNAPGQQEIIQAESSFIASQPQLTCAAGGAVGGKIVPVPIATVTTTTAVTSRFRPVPSAAAETDGAAATTDSGINLGLGASGAGGSGGPTQSVAQGAASGIRFTTVSISTSVVLGFMALPGLAALLL